MFSRCPIRQRVQQVSNLNRPALRRDKLRLVKSDICLEFVCFHAQPANEKSRGREKRDERWSEGTCRRRANLLSSVNLISRGSQCSAAQREGRNGRRSPSIITLLESGAVRSGWMIASPPHSTTVNFRLCWSLVTAHKINGERWVGFVWRRLCPHLPTFPRVGGTRLLVAFRPSLAGVKLFYVTLWCGEIGFLWFPE